MDLQQTVRVVQETSWLGDAALWVAVIVPCVGLMITCYKLIMARRKK